MYLILYFLTIFSIVIRYFVCGRFVLIKNRKSLSTSNTNAGGSKLYHSWTEVRNHTQSIKGLKMVPGPHFGHPQRYLSAALCCGGVFLLQGRRKRSDRKMVGVKYCQDLLLVWTQIQIWGVRGKDTDDTGRNLALIDKTENCLRWGWLLDCYTGELMCKLGGQRAEALNTFTEKNTKRVQHTMKNKTILEDIL